MKNLNREISRIKGATGIGLRLAATIAKIASMRRTPVDTGDLRGSHYVSQPASSRGKVTVEVGVMKHYGVYVHEDLTKTRKTGEAKFLEKGIAEKTKDMLEVIRRTARIR